MAISITLSKDEYGELLAENPKLADEYTQPEGSENYTLTDAVNGAWESGDAVQGLKNALKSEREGTRNSTRNAAEERDNALHELEQLKQQQNAGDETLRADFEALQGQFVALTGELGEAKKSAAVSAAVVGAKGTPLAAELIAARTAIDPDTGNPIAIDPNNNNEPLLNSEGEKMSPLELAKIMREQDQFYGVFIGTQSSGGGATPGGGNKTTGLRAAMPTSRAELTTPRAKCDFINQYGREAFERLQ